MIETKMQNCNTELLVQQKHDLVNDIINGEHTNHFKVIDLECGTGKTLTTEKALAKMIMETDKSALFVRLTKEDCRTSANRINDICKNKCALVFNNDLNKKERDELSSHLADYRVVCIAHQKYVNLSRDNRKAFTKGRDILVIDEFPSDVVSMKIDMEYIDFYKSLFKFDPVLSDRYCKIVKEIETCLLSRKEVDRAFVKLAEANMRKSVAEFKQLMKSSVSQAQLQCLLVDKSLPSTYKDDDVKKTVQSLCKQVDNIQQFYGKVCVLANNTIHTSDTRYDRWFLQNNILLDASGCLQSAYELDPKMYRLANLEPVLDHGKWTIYNILVNTTTKGKTQITNFTEIVNNILSRNEECLLVCKKEELDRYECKHKCYFGNITGSNEFRNLKNVVIAHTPNLDDIQYLVKYLHYNRKEIQEGVLRGKSTGSGITHIWKFNDERFERIREKWAANEIYQAIKRVNRQMEHSTKCFLLCNNQNVVKLVADKLKNCQVKEVVGDNFEFEFKPNRRDEYIDKLRENSFANKFITLVAELQDGKHEELLHDEKNNIGYRYKKKAVCQYLGINSTNFSHYIGNKTNVVQFCDVRGIAITGQYIVIPKEVA